MSQNKEPEKIVPYDSAEAASIQTVTGWVSRSGRFWGNDEHMARYDGCTHRKCDARLTLKNAPIGTLAPAIGGGAWCKVGSGWKWNGPDGAGSTFPRPGGDWNGNLIAPSEENGGKS